MLIHGMDPARANIYSKSTVLRLFAHAATLIDEVVCPGVPQ